METAPIVLFVYNRYAQTKEVLRSLSECQYASDSSLYIFSDAAKNKKAEEGVEKVRELIHSDEYKNKFKEIIIIEAQKNKGLANSVISGVSKVLENYDSVIVIEDDNRLAPDFLDYMNRGLQFYNKSLHIGSIGGYTAPIKFPAYYDKDVFAMGRTSSYAWATWRNRWELVDWNVSDYADFKKDKSAVKKFSEYGVDRPYTLENQINGKTDSWAIRFSYAMFKHDWINILPVKTRVENIGFDGSGVHNIAGDKAFLVKIESNLSPVVFENVAIDPKIKHEFVKLFKIPCILKIKRNLKAFLK